MGQHHNNTVLDAFQVGLSWAPGQKQHRTGRFSGRVTRGQDGNNVRQVTLGQGDNNSVHDAF